MKLLKLIIQNFRGLKGDKNVIDFSQSDIIFLIEKNNVDKSTFLDAYEFFTDSKQKALREDFYNYDNTIPIIIEGIFLKETSDDDDSDLEGSGRNTDPSWIEKWVDSDGIVRVRKKWSTEGDSFIKETFSPQNNAWGPNRFGGFDSLFTKYAPSAIRINAMGNENSLAEKVNKLMQDNFLKKIKVSYNIFQ